MPYSENEPAPALTDSLLSGWNLLKRRAKYTKKKKSQPYRDTAQYT